MVDDLMSARSMNVRILFKGYIKHIKYMDMIIKPNKITPNIF